jgi:hypothetical protein
MVRSLIQLKQHGSAKSRSRFGESEPVSESGSGTYKSRTDPVYITSNKFNQQPADKSRSIKFRKWYLFFCFFRNRNQQTATTATAETYSATAAATSDVPAGGTTPSTAAATTPSSTATATHPRCQQDRSKLDSQQSRSPGISTSRTQCTGKGSITIRLSRPLTPNRRSCNNGNVVSWYRYNFSAKLIIPCQPGYNNWSRLLAESNLQIRTVSYSTVGLTD